jgi:cytochrome c556
MTRSISLLSVFIAVGLLISGVTLPSTADAQMAAKERSDLMKLNGKNFGKLKKAKDTATMLAAAKVINGNAKKLASAALWPKGSHGGDTRAKIEIWQNMDDFKMKIKALENASANLIKVSMGGNLGAAKKAFGAMAQTCGGCHKLYQAPKKR